MPLQDNHELETDQSPFILTFLDKIIDPQLRSDLLSTNTQKYNQILTILKGYEPYSVPFLQRVSKREAPLYYDVIKNPMDLGTISKKLKRYKVVTEFKNDLDLIWNNCITFNGPSIYSEYAEKMRKKANSVFNKMFNTKDRVFNKNISFEKKNVVKTGDSINSKQNAIKNEEKNLEEDKIKRSEYYDINMKPVSVKSAPERSGFLMKKYVESKEMLPEIYFVKNMFPYKENEIYVEEMDLDLIKFDYHKIKIGKNNIFMNNKETINWDDVSYKFDSLDVISTKRVLEQINCVVLAKMGYGRVQKNAIKIFTDILYMYIFSNLRKIAEKCSFINDPFGVKNDVTLDIKNLIDEFNVPNVYDYVFNDKEENLENDEEEETDVAVLVDDILEEDFIDEIM